MRLTSRARGPLLAALLVSGCNLSLRPQTQAPDGGVPSVVNNGVGAPCTNDASCRTGLTCAPATHTCQPPGNRPAGGACTLTAECAAGLVCTVESLCAPRGTSPLGG